MARADLKTQKNNASVLEFLATVNNEERQKDCFRVMEIMEEITGEPAKMWGTSIVGFGSSNFAYASGRILEWMITGFSPRKSALTLYIMSGFGKYEELMLQLGSFKTGKSCLYIKRLSDIDEEVLRELITRSCQYIKSKYPS